MKKSVFFCAFVFFCFVSQSAFAVTDGFENGTFFSNWSVFGDTKWEVVATPTAYEGSYSARVSMGETEKAVAILQTVTNTKTDGEISFWIRSDANNGLMGFYIDGKKQDDYYAFSHDTWTRYAYPLSQGSHVLRWEYEDYSTYYAGDFYLDNIQAPEEDFVVHDSISYLGSCTTTKNGIWVGDFQGIISGLGKANFALTVNGEAVTDFTVSAVEASEMYTSMVMDYSGSMSLADKRNAEAAAIHYINLMSIMDQGGVIKFATDIDNTLAVTGDKDLLYNAVNGEPGTDIGGATALYDSIIAGVYQVNNYPEGKKAVIVYTDGGENASSAEINDVIAVARENNVPVYTIGIGDAVYEEELKLIATQTGGSFSHIETTADLYPIYTKIRGALSNTYQILLPNNDYASLRNPGAKIEVTVTLANGVTKNVAVTPGCKSNLLYLVVPVLSAAQK